MTAVRAKLNEYKFGVQTTVNDISTQLTVETGNTSTTNTGFAYAKRRYNIERDNYCPRDTASSNPWAARDVTTIPPATLTDLGREECVSGVGPCTGALDGAIHSVIKTFRLFVNLRHYNPLTGAEDCPWHDISSNYDFQNAQDMIKVTVTGLADLSTSTGYADITSASQRVRELVCQVSDLIRPVPMTARYWMQNDGRIFRWQGVGETQWEVFKSLAAPNNLGFAVSPDNKYVYLLRPGSLIRFEGCTGDPIDCDITSQKVWSVDNGLVAITAKWLMVAGQTEHKPHPTCGNPDFGNGLPIIFGLLNDRQTGVCIDLPSVGVGAVPPATPVATTMRYDGWNNGTDNTHLPFRSPTVAGRIHSVFMDPRGEATYMLDLTCPATVGRTNCAAIYDSNDTDLTYPLELFSVRAIAFSK